jgi:hypothetical protein
LKSGGSRIQHARQENVGNVVVEVDHEAGDDIILLRESSHKKTKKVATQTERASCRVSAVVDFRCGDERDGERLVVHVLVSCLVSIVDSEVKDCDVKQLESFMHAAVEK